MAYYELMTQITKGGRIVVPAKMRKALQIQAGDAVVLRLEDGSLRLIPLREAIRLAQDKVRQYIPEHASLVDDLIQARRAEGKDE